MGCVGLFFGAISACFLAIVLDYISLSAKFNLNNNINKNCRAMNKRLRYLPFSDVVEGMELGAPLTIAEHGVTNFTLPAGQVLTDTNLRQIAMRHGEFVCVLEDDPRSDAERAADRLASEARLAKIFADADLSRPALAGLYAAVLAYRSL